MHYVANVLSVLRLASVIPLLVLAWTDRAVVFLCVLLAALLSDAADGWFARRSGAPSATITGARLDSLADYALYLTVPLAAWWLWPERVAREAAWLALVVAGYAVPGLLALARFGRPAGYHTWATKVAVGCCSVALVILFVGGPAWPLYIGAMLALAAGLEQTVMICLATDPRRPVPSLWHAWRERRAGIHEKRPR